MKPSRADGELDEFFDEGPELLCVLRTDGCLERVKPTFGSVLGRSTDELLGRPARDFMHPGDVDRTEATLAGLEPGGRAEFENRWLHADGSSRTLSWSVRRSPRQDRILAIARDVTEDHRREDELRRATREAEAANTAKSEFLANMSHEIRTPMNGIIGMTELTLDTNLSDQQREYLQMVQASSRALLDTINSILDFSKIEAGRMELEQIDFTLWETVTGALKPLALTGRSKGVELLYDEAQDVPERLRGDPVRLRQALVNLVGNAVKFTEEGFVRVTIRTVSAGSGGIRLRFEVSDTGMGIPAGKHEHIFGSFNQVDGSTTRRFGGSGLGLAITQGLVGLMGGRIELESEVGKGSTFSFEADFEAPLEPTPRPVRAADLRGMRVLAVDDHEANRRILVEFARRMEMDVRVASSGPEAITLLEEAHAAGEPFQMALLDSHMPEMSGFELAESIRGDDRYADLIMVVVTAAGQPGDGARCEELGIASYLLRPLAPAELRDAILLTLEKSESREAPRDLVTRHSLREARQRLHVLLAEDNRVNQRLATHLLERFGHTFDLASTGREAVDAAVRGRYDAILMDIQMPEMDGIEATRLIREHEQESGRRTPIIAMTAHAMTGDRARFLAAGMDEYISKPISRDRLREALRDIERSLGPLASDPLLAADGPSAGVARTGASEGAAEPAGDAEPDDSAEATEDAEAPPSFDRSLFLEQADSDPELVRTLVEVFQADYPELLGEVDRAVDQDDSIALEHAAHTLKGALGVFAAGHARSLAARLEETARGGSVVECVPQLPELQAEVHRLEADLGALVDELDA